MNGAVDGLILAGGQGRRFGGKNKALITWRGQPLIQHVATRLGPQVRRLFISANKDLSVIRGLGWPTRADNPHLGAGPLAGLASHLEQGEGDWLVTVPTDMPLIPVNLVQQMCAALGTEDRLAVAHDGQRRQNCVMLVHHSLADSIQDYLAQGQRSVAGWLEETSHCEVRFEAKQEAFINLNSDEDLLLLEARQQVR